MFRLNVLIACEESQAICKEFRRLGHNAFSCDLQDCSGGHPEWHIKRDVTTLLNHYGMSFLTQDGKLEFVYKWDLIIAHPPCTYLSTAATRSYSFKCSPVDKVYERMSKRDEAARFFYQFVNCTNCNHIAIENPVGYMTTVYGLKKADQIIHPYMFAESIDDEVNYTKKRTCLWLYGLPKLVSNNGLEEPNLAKMYGKWSNGKNRSWTENRHGSVKRSKTFPGIAKAMAEQWSAYLMFRGDL